MANKPVSKEEFQLAKGIALRSAKNIVEDLGGRGGVTGTDISDALESGKVLTHQLAILRRWWNDR